jgi:enoyl-CoA hydratase
MYETLHVEREGQLTWLTLNRPAALNAMSRTLTRSFIDAARAERVGLVSRVVPDAELEQAARAMAEDILRNSPLGVRLTKECLTLSIDAPSLEAAIAMEDRNQILAAQTGDFREGIVAFLQKRPARFGDV